MKGLKMLIFGGFCLFLCFEHCMAMPHHEPGHHGQDVNSVNETVNGASLEISTTSEPPVTSSTIATTTISVTTTTATTPTVESTVKPEDEEIPLNLTTSTPPPVIVPTLIKSDDANNNASNINTMPLQVPKEDKESKDVAAVAAASSTSTTFVTASSPSIQLLPPPLTLTIPANKDSHLQDIPLSLLSIAGNSGGTTASSKNVNDIHIDFTQFRYHVETGKLHKIGSTGPGVCPENMRFFAVPGDGKAGSCDCDYYQCSRPLIYSQEKNQCYWAWSQGPCEKGEWFVFHKDLKKGGKCAKNPCPVSPEENGSLRYFFENPEDESCYEAGTTGYCRDTDERLQIYPGEPIPKCRKFTVCYPLSVPQELQCVYGNKFFSDGNC